jgi:glycosyltransferase involved in cell wall biosynthesis
MKAKGYNTDWEWYQENIKDYDLMVLGRTSFLRTVESFCIIRKYGNIPLVVDFDDHYAHVPDYNCAAPVSHQSGSAPKASKIQLISADAATVTTEPLARFYHDQARSITVLPNCVDPADWEGVRVDPERANDSSIRIVFAGGAGRYGDLLLCREAVETIMDEYPKVRLFFMGCFPDWAARWCADSRDPRNNRSFSVRWSPFPQWQQLLTWGGFDVALAPLELNDFNLCKSNLKYLDYGMGGIPAVYSRMPTYSDVVHGQTGLLAETQDEWYRSLCDLIEQEELRRHIATEARAAVLRDYNIEDRIVLWERAYEHFATLTPNVEAAAWQPQGDANERAAGLPSMQQRGV